MSYGKTPEELLTIARQLPPELDYDEAVQRFLNPVALPTPPNWWRRWRTHLKVFVMLSLFFAFILFLFPNYGAVASPGLTAFPVSEVIHQTVPVQPLPQNAAPGALAIPPSEFTLPEVAPPAPLTSLAPAPSASSGSTPTPTPKIAGEAIQNSPVSNVPTPSSRLTELPPALFSGKYSLAKDHLMLGFAPAPERQTNLLFMDITDAERRAVKSASGTLTIRRDAGSLLLYPDEKDGRFEFLPDPEYQADMTARGWGASAIPDGESLVIITEGKHKGDTPLADRRPVDQLWFRYFTTDISERYVGALQAFGYTAEELTDLWHLANWGLDIAELTSTLALCEAIFTDRPPLVKLTRLNYGRDELQALARNKKRLSFADYERGKRAPVLRFRTPEDAGLDRTEAIKQEKNLNFSLDLPGSTSDTIAYTPGEQLLLRGNFKFRISKEVGRDYVVVFGPEKYVAKMKKRSDYAKPELIHKNKKKPLFVELPIGVNMLQKRGKRVTMEVKMNPPAKQR